MMKKARILLIVAAMLGLAIVDGFVLLSTTVSAAPVLYSAGEPIRNRDGQITGCRCPRMIGECTCEWVPPQQ